MADKPRSREKNVTGNGTGLYRRGEGLNQSAPTSGSSAPMGNGGGGRKGHGGGSSMIFRSALKAP